MLPWKNSWFQIAFFAWLVSGALLVVDYAPKVPVNTTWLNSFRREPGQRPEAPPKPSLPKEQQFPATQPAPAQEAPNPPPIEAPAKGVPSSPPLPSIMDEAKTKAARADKFLTEENGTAALPLATEACDVGEAHACLTEAILYDGRAGITKDETKYVSLLHKACDIGDLEACVYEGGFYAFKGGDGNRAYSLYAKACNGGNSEGCHMGFEVFSGNTNPMPIVPRDTSRVLLFAKMSCAAKDMGECSWLGDLYRNDTGYLTQLGISAVPDRAQAIAFYRRACAGSNGQNDASACLYLKQMNATGEGIAQDYAKSLAINRKACDAKNHFGGCGDLGIMYENGLGVPADLSKAVALYTEACDGKNQDAQDGCAALKRLGK
jgi:TPR repeat protein